MKKKINNTKLSVIQGDPLKERADILVNWTTPRLNGGDALFFRIHDEGSSTIYKDCQRIMANLDQQETGGAVPYGNAVVTTAGILPVKFIVHSILPDYRIQTEERVRQKLLDETLQNVTYVWNQVGVNKERINKIIITPIPSLVYGVANQKEAATVLIKYLLKFAEHTDIRSLKIICETPEDYKLYVDELYRQTATGFERLINRLFKLSL